MTPALLHHDGDVLPWEKFEHITSAVVWDREGHFRLIPEGRVRDFHRLRGLPGDLSQPIGIRWEDTDEPSQ